MCLENDDHVQLRRCPHGVLHLRVANTTLHLTRRQVLALHGELNRCVHGGPDPTSDSRPRDLFGRDRFGRSSN